MTPRLPPGPVFDDVLCFIAVLAFYLIVMRLLA